MTKRYMKRKKDTLHADGKIIIDVSYDNYQLEKYAKLLREAKTGVSK
ncbi:hypothetical protein HB884_14775 [Listeria booriae]|uniref:Uncharacterized protein n=1 Tax=Listeria booriae TaxID=1552123 RepID=A0A7X0XC70_9LIST|nr:hypothetical protein [Listeria booriae]MBC1491444.1 hypothetical protein [Listeria booriae]MBC1525471.1 hypothetical protein [Listeria booriae]